MEKHIVTIKDVAMHCGVSVATVSRVLNNVPNVKPKSRDKVLKAMQELNYVPNRLAASLKHNFSKTIGLISIDLSNPAQMKIAQEIESFISNFGYVLFIMNSEDDAEKERAAMQTLSEYMVDGIILTATGKNTDLLASINASGTPVVVLDRNPHNHRLHYVGADKGTGCYDVTSLLAEMGYRRIAFVDGPKDIPTSYDRFNGFIRALYDHDLPVLNEHIYHNQFTSRHGYSCFQKIWTAAERPDSIISCSEMITIGILEAARDMKVRIPEDIGLLSFGNIANPGLVDPKLTYLESHPDLLGRKAAELMMSILQNPESEPEPIEIPTKIVMGNSLRQQSNASAGLK